MEINHFTFQFHLFKWKKNCLKNWNFEFELETVFGHIWEMAKKWTVRESRGFARCKLRGIQSLKYHVGWKRWLINTSLKYHSFYFERLRVAPGQGELKVPWGCDLLSICHRLIGRIVRPHNTSAGSWNLHLQKSLIPLPNPVPTRKNDKK